ncbi:MAG: radical SAM protein [Desulfosarcinaceae bacterium]
MKIIRQILRPDPKVLYLEPVFGCNYRCFFCIHGSGPTSPPVHLKPALFEKLKPLIERTAHIHFTGLGEPLLNPHLPDYLAYLRERDKTYYINTNGSWITGTHAHLLTTSRCELSISLDAGDGETYRKMRSGGSWQKVIAGLKRVSQLKKGRGSPTPLLYLSFHVNGLNLMSLPKIPQLGHELGIDAVKLSWTRLPEAYRAHSIFDKQEQVAGILRHVSAQLRNRGIKVQNGAVFDRHLRSCWNFSEMTFIGPNGSVAACCSRWPTIGNLMNNGFRDIWNGMPRRRLALAIINGRPQGVCRNCRQIGGLDYARNRDDFITSGNLEALIRKEKSRRIEKLPCLDGLDTAFDAGVAALLGGGFQKAVDIFSTLDANFHDFFEIKNNLAVAHAHLGNFEQCRAVLKALMKIPHIEKMYPKSIVNHPAFSTEEA